MFEKLEKRTCLSGFSKVKNNFDFDLDFSTQVYFSCQNSNIITVDFVAECRCGCGPSLTPIYINIGELK